MSNLCREFIQKGTMPFCITNFIVLYTNLYTVYEAPLVTRIQYTDSYTVGVIRAII
jgi:hypothetical protein